jgi:hypothetical protein
MRISKISSKATYHKCLKNLHALGYIKYEPSYNPYKGSMVSLFNFSENLKPKTKMSSIHKQAEDKLQTSIETGSEQAVVSYINSINNTKNIKSIKEEEQSQNIELENFDLKNQEEISKQKKLGPKSKNILILGVKPKEEEVIKYFQEQNFPGIEANKFYNYFSSNGWLVGGKTPMKNWQAAAKNWMINSAKYNNNNNNPKTSVHPQNLNTATNKNYSEPL